jgi:hypothetical protein
MSATPSKLLVVAINSTSMLDLLIPLGMSATPSKLLVVAVNSTSMLELLIPLGMSAPLNQIGSSF